MEIPNTKVNLDPSSYAKPEQDRLAQAFEDFSNLINDLQKRMLSDAQDDPGDKISHGETDDTFGGPDPSESLSGACEDQAGQPDLMDAVAEQVKIQEARMEVEEIAAMVEGELKEVTESTDVPEACRNAAALTRLRVRADYRAATEGINNIQHLDRVIENVVTQLSFARNIQGMMPYAFNGDGETELKVVESTFQEGFVDLVRKGYGNICSFRIEMLNAYGNKI